jgi:hypothetical protein
MSEIRPCTREDIPAVAGIFHRTFRNNHNPPPRSLELCLNEILFDHPWFDPELPSRVFVTPEGKVGGFMGTVALHMSYRGKAVRAAVPTSLAVENPARYPLAGARLVRAFLSGPQDLSISEPANALSQGLMTRLGAEQVPSESMEWLRIFEPGGFALSLLGDHPAARIAAPLFRLGDRLVRRTIAGDMIRLPSGPPSFAHDADVSDEALLAYLPELTTGYELRPDWDPAAFKFVLGHAARNEARGTLYRRVVFGKDMKPIGCYVYHGRPGRVAFVLQVLSRPGAVDAVLDSLFAHSLGNGSVAVKGRTEQRLLDPLLRRGALFFRRHSSLVHSRHRELVEAVRAGTAVTGGLAGESWMRLCGDRFK